MKKLCKAEMKSSLLGYGRSPCFDTIGFFVLINTAADSSACQQQIILIQSPEPIGFRKSKCFSFIKGNIHIFRHFRWYFILLIGYMGFVAFINMKVIIF